MEQFPDDPIISCMERTGYPPWFFYGGYEEEGEEDEDEDEDSELDI